MNAMRIYCGSDGEATLALYRRLEALGPAGIVAMNLFRAQKASERAKGYRGRRFKSAAYGKKGWSLGNVCQALLVNASSLGIYWGWKVDPQADARWPWVLYVNLPPTRCDKPGQQVSFHSGERLAGPDYPGDWDKMEGQSAQRIVGWVQRLVDEDSKNQKQDELTI